MTPLMRSIGIFALVLCTPLAVWAGSECDEDGDGVPDDQDVCCGTPLGVVVDETGRPIGDLDGDCDVDLNDFALMQTNFTGPLAPCPPECTDNSECPTGEMCLTASSDCGGVGECAVQPAICPLFYDPVCGCDGETYGNACIARQAGINVDHEGVCIPTCQDNTECALDEFCSKSVNDCGGSGECRDREILCFTLSPVCGCDGETYTSYCAAAEAGVNIVHTGPCAPPPCIDDSECSPGEFCSTQDGDCNGAGQCNPIPDICAANYDPVCGCDGETYSNPCYAKAAGVNVESQGVCPQTCRVDSECDQNELCLKENCADIEGECVDRPQACVQIFAPVCGCDQNTYANACLALAAGVNVASDGPCVSECTTNVECSSAGPGYCHRAVGDCTGAGQCQPLPVACPLNYDPVCGCDGQTYGNACAAAKAGVNIENTGVCMTPCTEDTDCLPNDYCDKVEGDCLGTGVCAAPADLCPQVYLPVCGCDDQTYGNACEASAAGVNVDHEGECCE